MKICDFDLGSGIKLNGDCSPISTPELLTPVQPPYPITLPYIFPYFMTPPPPTVSSALCPKSLLGRGDRMGGITGSPQPYNAAVAPWGEGRPYRCGAPLGIFGPWGG